MNAVLLVYLGIFAAYITNIVQLVGTDFGHLTALIVFRIIGVFLPLFPVVTVWF